MEPVRIFFDQAKELLTEYLPVGLQEICPGQLFPVVKGRMISLVSTAKNTVPGLRIRVYLYFFFVGAVWGINVHLRIHLKLFQFRQTNNYSAVLLSFLPKPHAVH